MNIVIIGTRGIPNHYGGFEQCAQHLALELTAMGHRVSVYNPHNHPWKEAMWQGVHIIHCKDPENRIGTAGQFVYDFRCIMDSRKRNFDIILNLGYTSSSVWSRLFPKKPVLITNMDGLEWKRSKYSKRVQAFLRYAEKLAVKHSDELVADSRGIESYLKEKYKANAHYIAYGAIPFESPDQQQLAKFNLQPFSYNMLVARMEPENNIEIILEGARLSHSTLPFLIIGNTENTYGKYLTGKYGTDPRFIFGGPVYEPGLINNLRYFSNIYFHGHSVGGTNPSLLEAMACMCSIAAHHNTFNEAILGADALYFSSAEDVSQICGQKSRTSAVQIETQHNFEKIKALYSWSGIAGQYEQLMKESLKRKYGSQ
ncbi:MAG: DUF1972 domain-containing protein [Bacteroidetes bacterium]|nr:DUF1972 domain-containing protein [Bacteroidota bacterium]